MLFCFQGIMIFTWIDYTPSQYGDYHFPAWADVLGWMFTMTSVMAIPVVMVVQVCRAPKKESIWATIKFLAKPADDWGPAIEKHRAIATSHEAQIPLNMSSAASLNEKDIEVVVMVQNGTTSSPEPSASDPLTSNADCSHV